MIQVMVAIRDSAVDAYMRPFFVPAVGAALRAFSDEVNRGDSDMGKHAADYVLYELGLFDDASGRVTMGQEPRQLARAIDVKESVDEPLKA